jgi:hypothetical protein
MIAAHACRHAIWLAMIFLPAACAVADEPLGPSFDPPADVETGLDYEVERADSLDDGALEVGVGFTGSVDRYRRRRHVRFSGDSLDGSVREGTDDALAGSDLEGALLGGWFGVGRVAPRWGRGLAIGSPASPWAREPRRSVYRRKPSEDLAWYRRARGRARFGLLAGQIERRSLAGIELGFAEVHLGLTGDRAGPAHASAWWAGRVAGFELAAQRNGHWRAEMALDRSSPSGTLRMMARGGSSSYVPLGDLRRAGPSRALAVGASRALGSRSPAQVALFISLWRFAPGLAGARLAAEWDQGFAEGGRLVAGIEEQHGTRRDPRVNVTGARAAWRETDDRRQGLWAEWRSRPGPVSIGVRHEAWGERWARGAVRHVVTARAESRVLDFLRVRVTHAVFRLERGEHVYLPEPGADRLVMRSLSGQGERVRVELGLPFAGGELSGAVHRTRGERPAAAEWSLDWTRRARVWRP